MIRNLNFSLPAVDQGFVMDDQDGRDFVLSQVGKDGLLFAYEPPLPQLLVAYLAKYPGTFVDIGANTGLFTLLAASISDKVRVVAFEPLAKIFAILSRNVQLNEAVSGRITLIQAAVTRITGTVTFYETINLAGLLSTSSSVEISHARMFGDEFVSTDVSAITLDSWSSANPSHDLRLIKIDCEGHEQGVLEGATGVIQRVRPVLVVELLGNSDWNFFRRFLETHNYINFIMRPDSIKQQSSLEFDPHSWNHVFCPAEQLYQFIVSANAARLDVR